MKLSERQKEVIKLMQQGWELYTWTDEHFGKKGQTVYKARIYEIDNGERDEKQKTKLLHHHTFSSLRHLNLIGPKPYHLTELGKTIQL